ncbi:unnamed protein product, partial [Discosporangium mesarthrocarpum]
YCTNCTIYLAVYGFTGEGYSLLASQGLTRLQEGLPQQGAVQPGGDEYYAFFNPAGSGGTQIGLTVLTGDPDLFMVASPEEHSTLPGDLEYDWAAVAKGHPNNFI